MQSDDRVQFYTSSNWWVMLRPSPSAPRKKNEDQKLNIAHSTLARSHFSSCFFSWHSKCSRHKKNKVEYQISNNIAVTSRGEELHNAICHRHLRIANSVAAATAPHPPCTSFDPTYQWEEGGKAMHGGSGYCNWWWCAAACSTATAMCSSSPLVVIVIDRWRGRRRRIAFCLW